MGPAIGVLTNPNSGKNRRNPGRRTELERAAGRFGIVIQTRDLGDLEAAVHELLDAGCSYWVCDGGDGTLHWLLTVGHKLARARLGDEARLPRIVPANGGSIDFVAHKAGIRGRAPEVVRALVDLVRRDEPPKIVALDTLRVICRPDGDPEESSASEERIGFATAIGGVAQRFFGKLYGGYERIDAWSIVDVLARSAAGGVARSVPPPLGTYLVPSLQIYADEVFEPTRATVDVDGKRLEYDTFSSLQIGAIDISLGGVVRTFRHAAADGVLHAQALSSGRLGVVANLPNIVMGTPIWGRNVYDGPAQRLTATAPPGEHLDPVIDGELVHNLRRLEVVRGPKLEIPAVCT